MAGAAIAHLAFGGSAGLFHAGRAGQGSDWAGGNDVAVWRAGWAAQRRGLGPVWLLRRATAILAGGIP